MFTTYVLQSRSTGRLYTGSTADFERRFEEHNFGLSKSTRNGGPWELLYREDTETRAAAMVRERYFKTGAGRDELNRILKKRP
ncbi:MAG: GIY-YIG nuclease family protein [Terracidiphilus sp.]